MAASPKKRVAWDACAWISMIQKEKIRDAKGVVMEDRGALARSVIDSAEKGKLEIVSSGLCLVEVCKNPPGIAAPTDGIADYFEHDHILVVPVDKLVGTKARQLMLAGHPGLKPPDATHLATAIVANVDELHTFDQRLLDLDEKLPKLNGEKLKICKPALGGPAMPPLDDLMKAFAVLPDDEKAKKDDKKTEPPAEAPKPTQAANPKSAAADTEVPGDGKGAGVQPQRGSVQPTAGSAGASAVTLKKPGEEVVEKAPPSTPPLAAPSASPAEAKKP